MNHTTFLEFHAAVLTLIQARLPELKAVTAYERLPEHAAVPRALVEVPDGNGDIGTEQYQCRISFSIYLVGDPRDEPAAKLAIRALAARASARLNGQHPGTAGGSLEVKGAYFDFLDATGENAQGRNSAGAIECWRVDCECGAVLEEDIWESWPAHEVEIIFADGVPEYKQPMLGDAP